MAQDTEFSFFSVNSATVSASDSMLGGRNLTQIFEDAGAKINTTLMDFYSDSRKNTDSAPVRSVLVTQKILQSMKFRYPYYRRTQRSWIR